MYITLNVGFHDIGRTILNSSERPLSAHSYHVCFRLLSHKPLDFGGLQSGTVTTDALGIVSHPSPEHFGLRSVAEPGWLCLIQKE